MEMRKVNFFNEVANEWVLDAIVKVVPHKEFHSYFYNALGSVEYTDGSFLDVYYNATEGFVGVAYDEECNPL